MGEVFSFVKCFPVLRVQHVSERGSDAVSDTNLDDHGVLTHAHTGSSSDCSKRWIQSGNESFSPIFSINPAKSSHP